jgi:hypothetical protein
MTLTAIAEHLKTKHLALYLAIFQHRTHRGEKIDFINHKYMKQLFLDESDELCCIKSTQCGGSEFLLIKMFEKCMQGRNVFYVLPTDDLVGRFVRNRLESTISYTPFYKGLTKERKGEDKRLVESVRLRDLANGTVAFVGSQSVRPFSEFPADDLIIDELDFCNQNNIMLGWERLSASQHKQQIKIGNPTIENFGIDAEYAKSKQYEWHIKCECGANIKLDFFKHILKKVNENDYLIIDKEYDASNNRDINCICDLCGRIIDRKGPGSWIPANPYSNYSGYRFSKLFSGTVSIREMVDRFNEGLANSTKLQRFYNADLGQAFTAEGAKINRAMLDACIDNYVMPEYSGGPCVAGIDVGAMFHIRISKVIDRETIQAVYIGSVKNPEDVLELLKKYNVKAGVIDGMPETRISKDLCTKYPGLYRCYYSPSAEKHDSIDYKLKTINVDRTAALDNVKENIILKKIKLPMTAASLPEYYDHMMASTRVFDEQAAGGEGRYTWVEGSKADHLFHAESYGLIAKRLLLMLAR